MANIKEALETAGKNATSRLLSSVRTAYSVIGTAGGVVTLLSYVLSTVGFGFGSVRGILFAVIAGLLTVVGLLVRWSMLYRQEVRKQVKERLERQSNDEPTEEIDRTLLAYGYSIFMHENVSSVDEQHSYTFQKWIFDLTGDDLEYRTVLEGKNWQRDDTDSIKIKLFGDVESNVDEMGFKAYQREPVTGNADRVQLQPETVGSSETSEAIIEIPFEEECTPLEHDDSFTVEYQVEPLGDEAQESEPVIRHVPVHRFKTEGSIEIIIQTNGREEDVEAVMAEVDEPTLLKSPGKITVDDIEFTDITDSVTWDEERSQYEYSCGPCGEVLFLFRIWY